MSTSIHDVLKKYWGYSAFRPLQEDIISSAIQGNDTLALLPTGGGKSLCFQVPAMYMEGICIVISPLIALMKDQVNNLLKRNIKAVAITSAMTRQQIDITLDNCVYGDVKFLYMSPERLQSEVVQERLKRMKVNMIAVDEAHCISQWGYDFRPAYLNISTIREILPKIPILALTATATPEVVQDIQDKLLFKKQNVFKKSFERSNLSYNVLKEEDKRGRLLLILNKIPGSSVVYVRNRKKTKEYAEFLSRNNISADYYHAGLTAAERDLKQERWIKGTTRVIVCTNAFGMGIDKPDVRSVVHLDVPESLEGYFQEAGRGGRDEQRSYAVLLFDRSDLEQHHNSLNAIFPDKEEVKRTYVALCNHLQLALGSGEASSYNLDLSTFCNQFNLNPTIAFHSLKCLEKEGYISFSESEFQPSVVHFKTDKVTLHQIMMNDDKTSEFIKVVLRSYGGVFDGFVKIKEEDIAKRCGWEIGKVINELNRLAKLDYIDYVQKYEGAKIYFNTPRLNEKTELKFTNYNFLKERMDQRIKAVISFCTSEKCRSNTLLYYFGEVSDKTCGVCDVCRKKKFKTNTSDELIARIKSLCKQPLTITELMTNFTASKQKVVMDTLQWMQEAEMLEISNGRYKTKKEHEAPF